MNSWFTKAEFLADLLYLQLALSWLSSLSMVSRHSILARSCPSTLIHTDMQTIHHSCNTHRFTIMTWTYMTIYHIINMQLSLKHLMTTDEFIRKLNSKLTVIITAVADHIPEQSSPRGLELTCGWWWMTTAMAESSSLQSFPLEVS